MSVETKPRAAKLVELSLWDLLAIEKGLRLLENTLNVHPGDLKRLQNRLSTSRVYTRAIIGTGTA